MELKHPSICFDFKAPPLLIVPYGIETGFVKHGKKRVLLLIVPYGIETKGVTLSIFLISILLIVPYGIETKSGNGKAAGMDGLLIVPYGIET